MCVDINRLSMNYHSNVSYQIVNVCYVLVMFPSRINPMNCTIIVLFHYHSISSIVSMRTVCTAMMSLGVWDDFLHDRSPHRITKPPRIFPTVPHSAACQHPPPPSTTTTPSPPTVPRSVGTFFPMDIKWSPTFERRLRPVHSDVLPLPKGITLYPWIFTRCTFTPTLYHYPDKAKLLLCSAQTAGGPTRCVHLSSFVNGYVYI